MTLFACVQILHLAVAVARRDNSTLADVPLILYTSGPRATVYDATRETGVAAGQPLRQALLRAPQVVCQPAMPEHDQAVLAGLVALLQTFSPRVVTVTVRPHALIELDLGRRMLPQAMALAECIGAAIRTQLHLLPALGLARTRVVARVAAATADAGVAALVPPGHEAAFLSPLPIAMLPIDDEVGLTPRLEDSEPWTEWRTLAQPTSDVGLLGQALVALVVRDGRHLRSGRVLLVEGTMQREADVMNIIAQRVAPLAVG
jgi:hypothetical protein